jgi:chromate transporter
MSKIKTILKLFGTMFKIGLFTFGGGYVMVTLIENEFVEKKKWLSQEEYYDMLAIAESTPGPIAINMATFIGASQGGILGAILATLGVVLPSFIIILIIASVMKKLLKFAGVTAFLNGIRHVVVGLIVATGISLFLTVILSLNSIYDTPVFDWKALVIFVIIGASAIVYKVIRKKAISPILLIILSALLGLLFYGLL